jgi:hypothetical protein
MPKHRAAPLGFSMGSAAAAGGAPGRRTTVAAGRKLARGAQLATQLRRLEALGEEADVGEALRAIKSQQAADRYIASFLRRRGGWLKWQRTCGTQERARQAAQHVAAGPRAKAPAGARAKAQGPPADPLVRAVQRVLAKGGAEEEDPEEQEDFYFDEMEVGSERPLRPRAPPPILPSPSPARAHACCSRPERALVAGLPCHRLMQRGGPG